jgi:Flp pilus assembly protein TadG
MRRWRTRCRWWARRDEHGQSALEFVFVLPFVFIVIFLVAEATSILKTWMVLENASREGARYAAVRKTTSEICAETIARAGSALAGASCTGGTGSCTGGASVGPGVTVRNAQAAPGSETCVLISYVYTFRTPLMNFVSFVSGGTIADEITMNASTVMRLE